MQIPTEPIGRIPTPLRLIEAVLASDGTDPFSPFCDDTTTSRETAFAKIRARVAGTALASEILGGG